VSVVTDDANEPSRVVLEYKVYGSGSWFVVEMLIKVMCYYIPVKTDLLMLLKPRRRGMNQLLIEGPESPSSAALLEQLETRSTGSVVLLGT